MCVSDLPDADRSDGDLDQVWQRGPSSQLPQVGYVFGLKEEMKADLITSYTNTHISAAFTTKKQFK